MGSDQRTDGKAAQGIADGKRRFCGIFPTRERQRIRPALAVSTQVNGAKLRKLWDGYDAGELTSLFAVYLGVDSFSGAAF